MSPLLGFWGSLAVLLWRISSANPSYVGLYRDAGSLAPLLWLLWLLALLLLGALPSLLEELDGVGTRLSVGSRFSRVRGELLANLE